MAHTKYYCVTSPLQRPGPVTAPVPLIIVDDPAVGKQFGQAWPGPSLKWLFGAGWEGLFLLGVVLGGPPPLGWSSYSRVWSLFAGTEQKPSGLK